MARPPKDIVEMHRQFKMPPLRQYWREINRGERAAETELREQRKAKDKKRAKCKCAAYPWPHRPGGGFCRHPDPPTECWQPKRDWKYRPHAGRYTGLRRKLARASGLHPIHYKQIIDDLMPRLIEMAKQIKRQNPRIKYRNMTITRYETQVRQPGQECGSVTLSGSYQTAGPRM